MTDQDKPMGTCQMRISRPRPGEASLWESKLPWETTESVAGRHAQARIECRSCPLYEVCEAALSDMEQRGEYVDGVMAARYSDVTPWGSGDTFQKTCTGCGHRLWPQRKDPDRMPAGRVRHVGEGLCSTCYPILNHAVIYGFIARKAS